MFINISNIFHLVLFMISFHNTKSYVTVVDKGILPIDKGSIGIQFFIDVRNNHQWKTCQVHSWPKMCCFDDESYNKCYTDYITDEIIEPVMAKRSNTLIFLYPTLYLHDQVGRCDFFVKSQCEALSKNKPLEVSVNFNTKLNNKKLPIYLQAYKTFKRSDCTSLDEDTINDCTMVDCDLKYSGKKPFLGVTRKCVEAPICIRDLSKEIPDIVYVPKSNVCRDLDKVLLPADIYSITSGIGVVTESSEYPIKQLEVQVVTNCTTISENLKLLKDLVTGNLCPIFNVNTKAYSECCKHAIFSIFACIAVMSGIFLAIIFCIHFTIYMYKRKTDENCNEILNKLRNKNDLKKSNNRTKPWRLRKNVTNNLLRDVIVRDVPIELRESVINICDRINEEVRSKKRYRNQDLGSQVDLQHSDTETDSGSSSGREKHDDI